MSNLSVADCHNDLLMGVQHLRERGHADPFGDFWLPQLRAGNVSLQVLPIYTEDQFAGEAALRRCLLLLESAYEMADKHSDDVQIVLTKEDLRSCLSAGKIALVLAIEGAEPVGRDLSVLSTLFRSGIRMASMTWNRRTMLADGTGEADTGGRLTSLGIDAVQEFERLGLILDVSHLSEAGFWHVAELATKPFIASHSSCRALHDHPRNLTDKQMRAIAQSGGFVALNAFGGFLASNPSINDYVKHVSHAADILGAEHVALGPDFIVDVAQTVDPIFTGLMVDIENLPILPDFQRPADLPALGQRLIESLGVERAAQVASKTLITHLTEHLPSRAPV